MSLVSACPALSRCLVVVALIAVSRVSVTAQTTGVKFESGEYLQPVDPSSLSSEVAADIADLKNTGSYVFDANQYNTKRLTLNYFVRDFKSQNSRYFRAHPVFMECLQKIRSYMDDQDKSVIIKRGFLTARDAGSSQTVRDLYARSGCGATLTYKFTRSDVINIAAAAMAKCVPLFEAIQRDIGLVIMADSLHIHMTGPNDVTPHYESDGYSVNTTAQFRAWCLEQIDSNIDPPTTPDCTDISGLEVGETFPNDSSSAGAVVGGQDQPVTRSTTEDFNRLIQFPGRTIVVDNKERTSAWCGKMGVACVDCRQGSVGNAPQSRCANRLMSHRMYNGIRLLQKLVRDHIPNTKLRLSAAWAEVYADKPAGDHPADSLHYEGRQARLQLSPAGTSATLLTLSKLARCARLDFVKRSGDHVTVAVRKQKHRRAELVDFPAASLIDAQPPFGKRDIYTVPGSQNELPLFDADNQVSVKLSEYGDLGMYKDPNNRYFRLDPLITKCHEQIEYQQNKWNSKDDTWVKIDVKRGYLTKNSQASIAGTDPRFNKHPTGKAMEITYNPLEASLKSNKVNASLVALHHLVRMVVETCGPLLHQARAGMGLGVYPGSVYMDIRDTMHVWVDSSVAAPHGVADSRDSYVEWIKKRHTQAIEGRVINPDNRDVACLFSNPPHKQSPTFQHRHTETVRRRRREATPSKTACQPRADTVFCRATKQHRDFEVELVWREVKRKHLYHNEAEVKVALDKCLGNCGTCLTGDIYDEKVENCNNFMHWIPFDLLNDAPGVTNLFSRLNPRLRRFACVGGKECIIRAQLFSLLVTSMEKLYRPDPNKSVQEELYPATDNPLPVYDLMMRIYAIHARGRVDVWVKNTVEMTSLKEAIKVVMVFNKEVTRMDVYVDEESQRESVTQLIENWLVDWVTNSCPEHSREVLTPFEVNAMPTGISKRSVSEYSFSEELFEQRRQWEHTWLNSRIH